MRAEILKNDNRYIATSTRLFYQPVSRVWAMLTEDEHLQKWFAELKVGDLREGGFISFTMGEGYTERLTINRYNAPSILAFDWFGDEVQFSIEPIHEGSRLTFTQKFESVNEQRIKDLAGWHVCLDVIEALLSGKSDFDRTEEWKKWYVEYEELVKSMKE